MSESDGDTTRTNSTKIPHFHGKRGEDYGLWRMRLRAACRVKGLWNLIEVSTSIPTERDARDSTVDAEQHKFKHNLEKASGMIISALGNTPLRVVADADDDPAKMMKLLDARYASNRTSSRIAVQTQLYRMRYKDQDMSKYIDDYTSLFGQLEFMGKSVAVPDAHKAPMLLASIDPTSDMEPIAAALRTKDADDLTWDYVSTTLIDESNARHTADTKRSRSNKRKTKKKGKRNARHATADEDGSSSDESGDIHMATRALAMALGNLKGGNSNEKKDCDFCNRRGHTEANCFLNPDNPNNKLTPKMKERMMVSDDTKSRKKPSQGVCANGGGSKVEIAGMAQCEYEKNIERTTVNAPKDCRTYHDSGATSHVFHSDDAFVTGSIVECEPRTVLLADKSSIITSKHGEVLLPFDNVNIRLTHVLYIPGLGYNLVSVGRLADKGIESLFRSKDVELRHQSSGMIVGYGIRDGDTSLYALPNPDISIIHTAASVKEPDVHLWHRRLAHMNSKDLCQVHKYATGVPKLGMMDHVCRACRLGKAHKLPFKGKFTRALEVGDIVHSDIVGPLEASYPDRYRYFATFQDDHSRYGFAGMMRRKSDVGDVFIAFAHRFSSMGSTFTGIMTVPKDHEDFLENISLCIKRLHSDNAKEYLRLGTDLGGGVDKSYAPPYTPELNAIAERVNRTIADASRSMLIQANLPTCLWPFAIKHVIYVRNRILHSATKQIPYTLVTGEKPNLKNVRVFGCAAFVLKKPEGTNFDARAAEGVLLEIMDYGVYKVLVKAEKNTYSLVESRHVTFDESRFPGAPDLEECMDEEVADDSSWSETSSDKDAVDIDVDLDDECVSRFTDGSDDELDEPKDDDQGINESNDEADDDINDDFEACLDTNNGAEDVDDDGNHNDDDFQDASENTNETPITSRHRYPCRNRNPPGDWFMTAPCPILNVTTSDDPTLKEAMGANSEEREAWLNAIDEEFQSIEDNDTWESVDAPKGVPLPTHVVLNVKRDANGEVDRFKARIVAGGNRQTYGVDYLDTYAPVVDFSIVRMFLYLVLSLGFFVGQVDIKTAFLNGRLDEDVWVMSPRGIPGMKCRIYKLKKALYGLKQAHLAWHTRLCTDLQILGFRELHYAPCVFRRKHGSSFSFILVYVDDLLIFSTTQEEVERIVTELEGIYKLRRSEEVRLFLGVRLQWTFNKQGIATSLKMSQETYVHSVLRRFGMEKCKPALTPMVEKFFEGYDSEEDLSPVNTELYQQMIGSLLYLALRTRPDILVSVLILARFQQRPTPYCHRAAKRLIRYLKGTSDYGLIYTSGTCELSVFVDSDYAGDTSDRKSTTGHLVKLGNAVVNWGARKQQAVALSTCEAEYFALSEASKEVIWMQRVLHEVGKNVKGTTPLRSDNDSAITWAVGSKKHSKRSKHIDVRVHFIRDLVAQKKVEVVYVASEDNDADMLTKPLGRVNLKMIMDRISLRSAVEEEC